MVKELLALYLVTTASISLAAGNPRWENSPTMPEPLQEIYPAIWKQSLVVAGGLSEAKDGKLSVSAKVLQLQRGAKTWQSLPLLPKPRHHVMLVAKGETLLALGGFIESEDGQWTNTDTILKLSAGKTEWASHNPLPLTLSETVSAVLDGKIHLASGRTAKKDKNGQWAHHVDTDWHGVLDEKSGVWKRLAPIPTARNSACSVVIKDNWHVLGGRTVNGGNLSTHEVYNDKTQRWNNLAPMPEARGGIACATDGEFIYVFGGEYFTDGGGLYADVLRYEVARDKWKVISNMPLPTHGLGAVYWDDMFWVIGGAAQPGAKKTKAAVMRMIP